MSLENLPTVVVTATGKYYHWKGKNLGPRQGGFFTILLTHTYDGTSLAKTKLTRDALELILREDEFLLDD